MLHSEQDEDQLKSFQRKAQLNSAAQQLRMKICIRALKKKVHTFVEVTFIVIL